MQLFPGITSNPDVRFGKPCIAGTRVDVTTVVGIVAGGESPEVTAEYEALTVEQVRTALRFAAFLTRDSSGARRFES
jgi:uncharacterized protein (DUF433 family)